VAARSTSNGFLEQRAATEGRPYSCSFAALNNAAPLLRKLTGQNQFDLPA